MYKHENLFSMQQEQEATCSSFSLQNIKKTLLCTPVPITGYNKMMIKKSTAFVTNRDIPRLTGNTSERDYICGSLREKLSIISFIICFELLRSVYYSAELPGWSSCALHRCMTTCTCTWHAYSACMSPALKGNSVLQHIK